MIIYTIDPGNEQSAFLVYDTDNNKFLQKEIMQNQLLSYDLKALKKSDDILLIENIQCFGMAVGRTVFDTCIWIGRFIESWLSFYNDKDNNYFLINRRDIKLHFCEHPRAKDTNIRQALIDRFGKPGTKNNPGFLYGIKKDLWSTVAITFYWVDNNLTMV